MLMCSKIQTLNLIETKNHVGINLGTPTYSRSVDQVDRPDSGHESATELLPRIPRRGHHDVAGSRGAVGVPRHGQVVQETKSVCGFHGANHGEDDVPPELHLPDFREGVSRFSDSFGTKRSGHHLRSSLVNHLV